MGKKVQVLEPKKKTIDYSSIPKAATIKVAAYCRVSTESEEQSRSYDNQVTYYTDLINGNPEYEFVNVYADKGLSGTSADKRIDFQRMMMDARDGKIDLILTKSITRFARNTLDTLKYTRELKDLNVAVEFENERINTLSKEGEFMMTLFGSMAQEDSRKISESSQWGYKQKFKEGKAMVNTNKFLGYDKDREGNLVINKEEAEVIIRIYDEYLSGKSIVKIARGLEADGIKTGAGKVKWWDSTLRGILENEKYKGDLLQQKTVTIDYLSRKRLKNDDIEAKYYIENNHEAIISNEKWEAVQVMREKRAMKKGIKKGSTKYSNKYAFSSKVICAQCGERFRRRVWNSTNPSRKIVWQCKGYINNGKEYCDMKAVDDDVLKQAFVDMFNDLFKNKDAFLKTMSNNIETVLNRLNHRNERLIIDEEIEHVKDKLKGYHRRFAEREIDKEIFEELTEELREQLDALREKKELLQADEDRAREIRLRIEKLKQVLVERKTLLTEFNDEVFNAFVDHIEVVNKTHFVFCLKNGMKIN